VILWSYRRPEMTMDAIKRLLNWPNLQRLLVSIDGPRPNASPQELAWREATVINARILAEENSRIDVKAWEINEGSTAHGYRTLSNEFQLVDTIISLEEDNLITNEGLDFLTNHVTRSPKPLIASAYSKFKHGGQVEGIRHTNFPEQWGISMNSTQFGFYQQVMQEKKVRLKKIRRMFQETFYDDPIYCEMLSQFWFHHYNNMMGHLDYGDGVVSYSAVEAGVRYTAPWNSFVSDLGHLDTRGMNPRNEIVKSINHEMETREIGNQQVCLRCERGLSQMDGLGIRPILGGYSFRLRKLFSSKYN
jgi:hypothetical protein